MIKSTLNSIASWRPIAAGLLLVLLLLKGLDGYFPLPQPYFAQPAQVVLAANGEPLRSFGNSQGVHRYRIDASQVSPFYLDALLCYEDNWFYQHPGVNPLAILRALGQWARSGEVVSGASTLTMQVARLLSPHSRNLSGKLQQVFRAFQLEWHYSKREILNLYLNLAPFGGNLEGVEAAAQFYFGKPALYLNQAEAALLVVLPQRPSAYRPDRYPNRAQKMRNKVLARLQQQGLISLEQQQRLALQEVMAQRQTPPLLAPLLAQRLRSETPTQAVINTTIDMELQQRLNQLMQKLTYQLPDKTSAAVLIVQNATAEVLAYKGSVNFLDSSRFSHVDMTQAVRSPGSTLKPFIYGMALERGLIHSKSLLSDIPSSFNGYKPDNFDHQFRGAITASYALRLSLNVPAIQLLNRIGPSNFSEKIEKAGVHLHHPDPNLAIGLGGTGSRLEDLVALYRSLASQGETVPLRYRQKQAMTVPKQLLSKEASWVIWNTLTKIPAPDRTTRATRRQMGWKSGTSYGHRDTWAIGVSPDYTVGVWLGRPDGSPLVGYMGASLAGPVLFDIFDFLPDDKHSLPRPKQVEQKEICWPGGMAKEQTPEQACERTYQAYTLEGRTPPTLETSGKFVTQHQLPIRLKDWLKEAGAQQQAVRILTPKTGQHYFSDQLTTLFLKASQSEEVRWYINGKLHSSEELLLADHKGLVQVSACNSKGCDKQTIMVH